MSLRLPDNTGPAAQPALDVSQPALPQTPDKLPGAAMRYGEKRYGTLLEATTAVVWNADPTGQFVTEQPAWGRFTGQSFEQYQGFGWLMAVHPDDRQSTSAQWHAAVAGRSIFQVQARLCRNGNDDCHVLIHAVPVSDEQQQVREWIGSLTDITHSIRLQAASQAELRKREAELLALNQTLERRIRERTVEAETRAHQLRGLALDLAETESRERKRLAQMLHDHFQQLVSAAKLKTGMARRAVTDAKTIASLEQTERLLEEAIVASRSLATELSPPMLTDAGLIPALEWLGQKMENEHGLHVVVAGDPAASPEDEQLRRLLFECARELLMNVVRHAGVKEAALTLGVNAQGLLRLIVCDTGKGFEMGDLGAISKKNETSFGLFGIGERLSFVGGLMNVRSAAGAGTRVELSLPIGISSNLASTLPKPPAADSGDPSSWLGALGRPARVLVADDHKLFREGIISLLAQEPGLVVVGDAANGQDALDLARKLKPDILILDVTMPKLNGVQVAASVSRDMPQVCIVGLSMHEDRAMAKAMRAAGAAAYLSKGGSSESLLELLRSLTASNAVIS